MDKNEENENYKRNNPVVGLNLTLYKISGESQEEQVERWRKNKEIDNKSKIGESLKIRIGNSLKMNDKPDVPVKNEKDETELLKGITDLLNKTCSENASNTPDFILAEFLLDCLYAFNRSVNKRNKWYKKEPNETTVKTFKETDNGEDLYTVDSVEELIDDLDDLL